MAIQKKLIHFNLKSDFIKALNEGNILDTSIVFIKSSKEIWTHGQFYAEKDFVWDDIDEKDGWMMQVRIHNYLPSPNVEVIGEMPSKVLGRRCLVKTKENDDKAYICFLSDSDSNRFNNGQDASLDGSMGEVMVYFPEIYITRLLGDNNHEAIAFSNYDLGGSTKFDPLLLGAAHIIEDYNYIKRFSIFPRGELGKPLTNVRISEINQEILNFKGNDNWGVMTYDSWRRILLQAYAAFGTRDLKQIIGEGDYSSCRSEGHTATLGNRTGICYGVGTSSEESEVSNSLFGIENFSGNIYDFLDGICGTSNENQILIFNKHLTNNVNDVFNSIERSIYPPIREQYIPRKMISNEWIDLIGVEGIYEGDYERNLPYYACKQNIPYEFSAGVSTVICGSCGKRDNNPYDGNAYLNFDGPISSPNVGARIQYTGTIQIVNDVDSFINNTF